MTKSSEEIQLVNEWLSFARENLLFAKSGMTADFSPFHSVCFLCQGSGEKYLKAYLISKGWKLEKTHDMEKLLDVAVSYDHEFNVLFSSAEILNEYITAGRYPGDLAFEGIGEKEAREAIDAAEKIEAFVLEKIGPLPDAGNSPQSSFSP